MVKIRAIKPKRVVVKVGTAVLTAENLLLNKTWIMKLVEQIAGLVNQGIEVILVTSGAIGAGMGMLGLETRPRLLPQQQAAASIGQGQLMKIYDSFFKQHSLLTGQVLLTAEDLSSRKRYLNAKNTLLTLLAYKAVPIINENDTVSVDEIKFGDNDRLSALVATLIQADLLIILSDVDGLYARPPKAKERRRKKDIIATVKTIDARIEEIASAGTGKMGTGGMTSKVEASKICCTSGIPCIVANGKAQNVLRRILDAEEIGTLFLPQKEQLVARKRWIGFSAKLRGEIVIDAGAKEALVLRKKSLLPKGIIKVGGTFAAGDTVRVLDMHHREFARGLTNYSSEELLKIKGKETSLIRTVLGYKYYDEVLHRDNLVIL